MVGTKRRIISKRRDCRLMKCTTMPHGGVCYRTSTPHKSGNKMKEKKKAKTGINECLTKSCFTFENQNK